MRRTTVRSEVTRRVVLDVLSPWVSPEQASWIRKRCERAMARRRRRLAIEGGD
jgi:hypothetical protein